jgi:hypothetical protein
MKERRYVPEQIEEEKLALFVRLIENDESVRVDRDRLWRALGRVFPHRNSGTGERELLLVVLRELEERGLLRMPSLHGRRWDRTMEPAVPTSVDLVHRVDAPRRFDWRGFPWHPRLHWIAALRSPSDEQLAFLNRVHEGLVNGAFLEPAPFKYRSLQLTGHEKRLATLAKTSLFSRGRLTLDLLGCLPDTLPLAWEAIGRVEQGRVVIFENAGPFEVARRVLVGMANPPYDIVAYGGGRSIVAGLAHLLTIGQVIRAIDYVGDLDAAGLEIAVATRARSLKLALPQVRAAAMLHRAMIAAARQFGHAEGWPAGQTLPVADRILDFVPEDLRNAVSRLLKRGQRIPEEVLGPAEMRGALE